MEVVVHGLPTAFLGDEAAPVEITRVGEAQGEAAPVAHLGCVTDVGVFITDWAEVSVKRSASTSRSESPWRIHQRAIAVMVGLRERPCSVSA